MSTKNIDPIQITRPWCSTTEGLTSLSDTHGLLSGWIAAVNRLRQTIRRSRHPKAGLLASSNFWDSKAADFMVKRPPCRWCDREGPGSMVDLVAKLNCDTKPEPIAIIQSKQFVMLRSRNQWRRVKNPRTLEIQKNDRKQNSLNNKRHNQAFSSILVEGTTSLVSGSWSLLSSPRSGMVGLTFCGGRQPTPTRNPRDLSHVNGSKLEVSHHSCSDVHDLSIPTSSF